MSRYLMFLFILISACTNTKNRIPASIIGEDSRSIPDKMSYPLTAVGLIEVSDKNNKMITQCTGTAVSKDVVLTNAHCLLDRQKKDILNSGKVTFTPGILNSEKKLGTFTLNLSNKSKFFVPSNFRRDHGNDDYAFLRFALSDKVGIIKVIPFSENFLGKKVWNFASQVKSRDQYHIALNDKPCTIKRKISPTLLSHDCDAAPGSSGSPIFSNFEGQVFLVALHFGQLDDEKKCSEFQEEVCENFAVASQLFIDDLNIFTPGSL